MEKAHGASMPEKKMKLATLKVSQSVRAGGRSGKSVREVGQGSRPGKGRGGRGGGREYERGYGPVIHQMKSCKYRY